MSPFSQLIAEAQHLAPGERQARVESLLRGAVERSGLHWWSPGMPLADGKRLLVGVASYAMADMQLLDHLQAFQNAADRANGAAPKLHIDVFSVADCKSAADFGRWIPHIGKVFQTPVVGLWVDGELERKASGAFGREIVAAECGLPSS